MESDKAEFIYFYQAYLHLVVIKILWGGGGLNKFPGPERGAKKRIYGNLRNMHRR